MLSRRTVILTLSAAALIASAAFPVLAADKSITIGINLPLTGADAHDAELIKDGAMLALDEANAKGGVAGYKINVIVLDDGTATAGQYDPAQAATNARKMVADSSVVAAIGPQMSGSGKAMSPILSQGNLAIVTPASTNPDITDPKFAGQYRPAGKAIYFRTVTTDAFQGPNMANYFLDTLKIKSLNPDALYYGGVAQAGVKVVKQSYDIMPKMIRAGGDGVYGAEILKGAGFPSAEGFYATIAAPNLLENPDAKPWVERFAKKYGQQPENYSITAYDAALVILDAVKRVADSGKEVNRANVRDAIQTSKAKTLQGVVSFDDNGDITNREVSVFQIKKDDQHPLDSVLHQYKYLGIAPQSS